MSTEHIERLALQAKRPDKDFDNAPYTVNRANVLNVYDLHTTLVRATDRARIALKNESGDTRKVLKEVYFQLFELRFAVLYLLRKGESANERSKELDSSVVDTARRGVSSNE